MNITSNKVLKTLKEYVIISMGMFLYCFSWTAFLIPKGIVGGAATGFATLIYYATGGVIPVSATYLALNTVLIIIGSLILGKGFGAKTIYCILLATFLFHFLPEWIPWESTIEEIFLNALLGGLLGAIGIVMIFNQGGSTGGTDVVALVLAKYREVSPGRVFLICDLIIVGSVIFLPGRTLSDVVYGYIQMVSFSFSVDLLLTGTKQSVQIMIFSQKYKEIADAIYRDLNRGVTALESIGWYRQEQTKVLVVMARKQQIGDVKRIVKNIDDSAFMSITPAMGVYGRGFDEIKSGGKIEWKKLKAKKS